MKKSHRNPRIRTKFSKLQQTELEILYQQNNKPNRELMLDLGSRVGLDLRIIQVWFQNRRVKERNARLTVPGLSQLHNPFLDFMHMPACDAHIGSTSFATSYAGNYNPAVHPSPSYSSQYSDYIFGSLSQSSHEATQSSYTPLSESLFYPSMSFPPILTPPPMDFQYSYNSPPTFLTSGFDPLSYVTLSQS